MNIVEFFKYTNWEGDPLRYCSWAKHLEQIAKNELDSKWQDLQPLANSDFDFLLGAGTARDPWPKKQKQRYWKPERKNIIFDSECVGGWHDWEHDFDKVLHLCPHTSKWRNEILGEEKYQHVYFPIGPEWIPEKNLSVDEKTYDIVYAGSVKSRSMYHTIVSQMHKFNYALITHSKPNKKLKHIPITHANIPYSEKMSVIESSKICLVHNTYWDVAPAHEVKMRDGIDDDLWSKNFAFADIRGGKGLEKKTGKTLLPQLKSRTFEAASGCALILAYKDPFGMIENWFVEGEDFIYLEPDRYVDQVREILENYEDYRVIAESANKKLREKYTTLNFYRDFILPFAK